MASMQVKGLERNLEESQLEVKSLKSKLKESEEKLKAQRLCTQKEQKLRGQQLRRIEQLVRESRAIRKSYIELKNSLID